MNRLLDVSEADAWIGRTIEAFPTEEVSLLDAAGRVLAEDVYAERDQPPFDRVTMDGIALRHQAYREGCRRFPLEGVQAAGAPPTALKDPQAGIEAMTGAPLPRGCDCVVRIEDVRLVEDAALLPDGLDLRPLQNVHPRGSDYGQGRRVLEAGVWLNGPRLGLAATSGRSRLRVSRPPRIAIVSTGDELVDAGRPILPHQIRRSNPQALAASLGLRGFPHRLLRHASDDRARLKEVLTEALAACPVVVLTGGVSMGRFDYVPEVLQAVGVMPLFHKVSQRPGKPLLFGQGPDGQAVFGLPGNPVSALVCLYRHVLPPLERASGVRDRAPERAVLGEPVTFRPDLTYFLPVRLETDEQGRRVAMPRPANTSGDVTALAESDGFVELARGRERFPAGHVAPLFLWDR